jgi:predicted flap endonuclease-1-like 5' DNA nuclease
MEALGILIGAGLAALSPLIPALRPVTKAVIKGGMAVADAATGIAVATAAGWSGLTQEVTAERAAEVSAATEIPADDAVGAPALEPLPIETPVSDATTAVEATTGAEAAAVTSASAAIQEHDLTQINGIGPKVAALLNDAGISNLAQLASTDVATLQTILAGAGTRYRAVNPESWPEQAGELLKSAG